MTQADRIDVHQHVVPPFWAATLPEHGGDPSGWNSPDWSPESALAFMDDQQIATGILSLTAPSVVGWAHAERRLMTRRVNEYTADLVSKRPDRFGMFATAPLPDVEGALIEIVYALEALNADGVVLLSSYADRYLGDALYAPLWAELDRRGAVVFIHPGKPAIAAITGIPGPVMDYPFDTTRTAVHLTLSGVLDQHTNVKIILSHAGGYLPYAAHRFAELASVTWPDAPAPEAILAKFKRFYFDTALSAGQAAMPSFKAFADPGRILFGSDFPYAPVRVSAAFSAKLDRDEALSPAEHDAINHRNACTLFARLAA
jgi:predicted TIM-barrel fold metal-dependent hydrolase